MCFLVNKEEVLDKVKLVILKFFVALKGRYEDRRFLADSTITPQWNSLSYVLWFNFILDLNFIFLVVGYGNACVSLKQWEIKMKPRIK